MASAILITPYSIGYVSLSAASSTDLQFGSLINKANKVVNANVMSISSSIYENVLGGFVNLVDSSCETAWPIVGFTYILISATTSRSSNITDRIALGKFIEWLFTASFITNIASEQLFVDLPSSAKQSVISEVQERFVFSNGTIVLPAPLKITVYGSGKLSLLIKLYFAEFTRLGLNDANVIFFFNDTNTGDVSALFSQIVPSNLVISYAEDLAALPFNLTNIVAVPGYLLYIAITYNLPQLGSTVLILTFPVIVAIFSGKIIFWDDLQLLEYNPSLHDCHFLITILIGKKSDSLAPIINLMNTMGVNLKAFTPANIIYIDNDSQADFIVYGTPYAMSFCFVTKLIVSSIASIVNLAGSIVNPSVNTVRACTSIIVTSAHIISYNTSASLDVNCYPFVQLVVISLSTTFVGAPCVASSLLVRFLNWSLSSSSTLNLESLAAAIQVSALVGPLQQLGKVLLNNITCDGVSILPPPTQAIHSNKDYIVVMIICTCILGSVILIAVVVYRSLQYRPHNFDELVKELERVILKNIDNYKTPREILRENVMPLGLLGSGAFGDVHKALVDESKVFTIPAYICAVKILKKVHERNDLLKEAALLAQFDCKFVIKLIGVVTLNNPVMLVMEFCEGGSLLSQLELDNFSHKQKLLIAGDVAEGLSYLHSKSFIHRDIAARNILIATNGRAKISDFGLTWKEGGGTTFRDKPAHIAIRWAAPEAIKSNVCNINTDIWSFGVLLYEIWSKGEIPYKNITEDKFFIELFNEYRLPRLPECPENIYEIIMQCWCAEPTDRIPMEQSIAFFRVLAPDSILLQNNMACLLPHVPYEKPIIAQDEVSSIGGQSSVNFNLSKFTKIAGEALLRPSGPFNYCDISTVNIENSSSSSSSVRYRKATVSPQIDDFLP